MSYSMSRTVVLLLLCLTEVISTKNTKPKWPKSSFQDSTESPNIKQKTTSSSSRRVTSAAKYMMQLYNSTTKNQSYADGIGSNNTTVDSRAFGADTIISYGNPVYGKEPNISHHHAKFQFKIVKPEGENVTATEFRLYKQRTPPSKFCHNYVVRLYQIISPAHGLDLLETRVLRSCDFGWQAFDITQAGKTWLENPSNNYGLELAVENRFNHQVSPYKAGFVGFKGPEEFRPFIVSFFKHDGKKKYSYPSFMKANPQRPVRRSVERMRGNYCQRRPLDVTTRELGWDSWIVAPQSFSAYFCQGECSFPLSSHMNATTHAVLQSIVHSVNPETVPNPCCVPTEMSPMSILYLDDSGDAIHRVYEDMVVQACGCH